MTEKLYYEDAWMKSCTARVCVCEKNGSFYEIRLDRTCFYPEGGGQPGDSGMLDDVAVYDTREKDGEIVHYTKEPLAPGTEVTAAIDWNRRFDFMQQHSGEHMLSGLVHQRKGYENVGFHMGAETTTVDLSGELSRDELLEAETQVNRRIWENEPVKVWYPAEEELAALSYRSKKELTGAVRIVEFPDTDVCACCGTHVKRTGEIGLLKIISFERFHGGTRLELVCGGRAVRYLSRLQEQNSRISHMLSAKPYETAGAVEKLSAQMNEQRQRVYLLEEALFQAKAQELAGSGDALLFLEGLDADGVRRACDALQKTCGGMAAVFSGSDKEGYKYALARPDGDLRPFVKEMNAALSGRGGGRPSFAQGSVAASRENIGAFFKNRKA